MTTIRRAAAARRGGGPRGGFTIIEMLVVLAIILVLATLTVAAAFKVREVMQRKAARTKAAKMASAVDAYLVLKNRLPAVGAFYQAHIEDDLYENWELVAQLNGVMERPELLKVRADDVNAIGSYLDSYGRPLRLATWGQKFYEVYSCGPNRLFEWGLGDDLAAGK